MRLTRYAILFLIVTKVVESKWTTHHPAPVDPKQFAVMAWGESPSDAEQLRGMRDAGLNLSGFCRAADVDKVKAAGLACFVSEPQIAGLDLMRLPSDEEIRKTVAALKNQIGANPAALGFYLRDEPTGTEMPGLGRIAAMLREAMPDKWPYVNLLPYRVPPSILGTRDYDSYVKMLVKTVGQPFLSYDNYSLVNGEMLD